MTRFLKDDHGAFCEFCKREVESVDEADECEDCKDARIAREYAYWKPLYDGEKLAGLLDAKHYRDFVRDDHGGGEVIAWMFLCTAAWMVAVMAYFFMPPPQEWGSVRNISQWEYRP